MFESGTYKLEYHQQCGMSTSSGLLYIAQYFPADVMAKQQFSIYNSSCIANFRNILLRSFTASKLRKKQCRTHYSTLRRI